MASIRQSSFAGGELGPELWGRTDLARYHTALRRMRNFFPARSGAAVSRPGTKYLGAVKGGAIGQGTSTKVRLVGFVYSSGATVTPYLLEVGNLYLRVWQGGAYAGVEKTTPWADGDLGQLSWAQEGNTLTFAHPSHPPQELKFDGSTWTLSPVSFARPAMTSFYAGHSVAEVGNPGPSLPDGDHPAKEWSLSVTQLEKDADGNILESAPSAVDLSGAFLTINGTTNFFKGELGTYGGLFYASISDNNTSLPAGGLNIGADDGKWKRVSPNAPPLAIYPDKPIGFSVWASRTTSLMGGTIFGWRWYRGINGGPQGLVGDSVKDSTASGSTFTDTGDDPDYSVGPPQGLNPFDRSGTVENPNAVAYYESRRIFGGTTSRPHTVFASAVADYSNFDRPLVARKDDGLVFALASGRAEQIRSITWLSDLLVLTSSSIWAVSGGDGPLAFDAIQAVPQSQIGASWLPGIPVGRALLYVRDGGGGVRSLTYSWERQGYGDQDLALIASHLFRGRTVVDWAYAAEPWSIVWAVTSDGMLLSVTLARDEQEQEEGVLPLGPGGGSARYAWAWHDTQGTVESVCVLRENGEDVVYVAMARTVSGGAVRYVERLSSRVLPVDADGNISVSDVYALDCAKTYSGTATSTVTGLGHLEGKEVWAVADGNVVGPLTVTGGAVALALAASTVHIGLAFTPELELLDVAAQGTELRTRKKALKEVTVEVVESRGLQVGPDSDNLTEWKQRSVADGYGPVPYATEHVRISVSGGWDTGARCFIRQAAPLPITIAAVTREVAFGG